MLNLVFTKSHQFQINQFDEDEFISNEQIGGKDNLNRKKIRHEIEQLFIWEFDVLTLWKFVNKKIIKVYKEGKIDKKTSFYQFINHFEDTNPPLHKFVIFLENKIYNYIKNNLIDVEKLKKLN